MHSEKAGSFKEVSLKRVPLYLNCQEENGCTHHLSGCAIEFASGSERQREGGREREREREGEREREQKKRERKQEEKKDSVEGHLYVFGLNPKPHQTRSVWTGLNQSQVAGSSVGRSLEL